MKARIFTILFMSFSLLIFHGQARAQGGEEPQYLFSSDDLHISGFGGPQITFSIINDEFATFVRGIDNSLYGNNMFSQPTVQLGVIFGNFNAGAKE